ncbi:MAG: bacillithiol biosynthesis deacetylase BshB1 [Sphingomonadales bacterium]|nr:bacillithiol biosynthesis deacetylase BshB1 [Sphingomonadales bacterium]
MNQAHFTPLDVLAIAAHPDDAELGCGGTLLLHKSMGYRVGVVDLTRGEMGSRGNADLRDLEARAAADFMGLDYRAQLGMADGLFEESAANLQSIAGAIRYTRPRVVLANARGDRHPDHGRAARLVARAIFMSGLPMFETWGDDGHKQEAFRPELLLHYIQDHYRKPDVVVDITPFFEGKMDVVRCYSSQFHDPDNREPKTPISGADFFPFLEARAREMGRLIGVTYGEGFETDNPIKNRDLIGFT